MITTTTRQIPQGNNIDRIFKLASRGSWLPYIHHGYSDLDLVGSGDGFSLPNGFATYTGVVASSSAMAYVLATISTMRSRYQFNFDAPVSFKFMYERYGVDAEASAWVHFKDSITPSAIGDLAMLGIGIKCINMSLWGESYGTVHGLVDLGIVMTEYDCHDIVIDVYPAQAIIWTINGVVVGRQNDVTMIPSGINTDTFYFASGIQNGITGGVNARQNVINVQAFQERG